MVWPANGVRLTISCAQPPEVRPLKSTRVGIRAGGVLLLVLMPSWPSSRPELKSKLSQNVRVTWLKPDKSIAGLYRNELAVSNGWSRRLLPHALVPEWALVASLLLGVP